MQTIQSERREASSARVPTVPPGKAIVFTRYEEEKTVVIHPTDFHRLVELDEALTEIAFGEQLQVTELVRKAHQLEDEPGRPIEDAAQIETLLGL